MAAAHSASIDNSNVIRASRTQRDESAPTTAGQRQWSIWSISDHHSLTSYIAVTACARHAGTADFCHSVTVIVIRQVGQLRLVKRNGIQYNKSIYNARMESVKFYYFSHTTVKKMQFAYSISPLKVKINKVQFYDYCTANRQRDAPRINKSAEKKTPKAFVDVKCFFKNFVQFLTYMGPQNSFC